MGHAPARRDHQEHPARSHRPPPQSLWRRHAPDDLLGFHHAADRHDHRDDRRRHHRADLPLLVLSRQLLPRLQVRHESRRAAADRRRADGLLQPARPPRPDAGHERGRSRLALIPHYPHGAGIRARRAPAGCAARPVGVVVVRLVRARHPVAGALQRLAEGAPSGELVQPLRDDLRLSRLLRLQQDDPPLHQPRECLLPAAQAARQTGADSESGGGGIVRHRPSGRLHLAATDEPRRLYALRSLPRILPDLQHR